MNFFKSFARILSRNTQALAIVGALALGSGFATKAHAEIINLDFNQATGSFPYDGNTGALPSGTTWNSITSASGATFSGLKTDNNQSQSTVVTGSLSYSSTGLSGNTTNNLLKDFVATSTASPNGTFTLNNLAANSQYTLYLYGTNFGNSATNNATTFTVVGGTPATSTITNSGSASGFILGNNYTVITGTTAGVPNTSTSLTVSYTGGAFSGVQAQVSPVPEPSTYAMMLLGVGTVVWVVRRKKVTANIVASSALAV